MEAKPWYTSKVLWLNLATLVSLAMVLPEVGAIIPPAAVKFVAAGNALLNLALRIFGASTGPISLTQGSADKKNGLLVLLGAVLGGSLFLTGCGGKPLILVAQTGQTLAGTIGEAQKATTRLTDAGVLTPGQALPVQRALLRANDRLKPLPDLLIAIDDATKAGQRDAARVDAALAILASVGVDLDTVIAGLPVGETASQVLKATTETRKLIAQITAALARQRAAAMQGVAHVAA